MLAAQPLYHLHYVSDPTSITPDTSRIQCYNKESALIIASSSLTLVQAALLKMLVGQPITPHPLHKSFTCGGTVFPCDSITRHALGIIGNVGFESTSSSRPLTHRLVLDLKNMLSRAYDLCILTNPIPIKDCDSVLAALRHYMTLNAPFIIFESSHQEDGSAVLLLNGALMIQATIIPSEQVCVDWLLQKP